MTMSVVASLLAATPIPKDITLPQSLDPVILQGLLVVLFLAHLVFVNFMVGGSILTVAAELAGRRNRDFDRLAEEIAATITVNKSLAVVLGVGPLLCINLLYTLYFYSANALTGNMWISIVPLVIVAFLLSYWHKYSWRRMEQAKSLHIAIGAAAALLFMFIPLVFLTNINLMLFPEEWGHVKGFWSALMLANVWPRYAHFLVACVAVTSLFLLIYMTRRAYPVEQLFEKLDRSTLRRGFYWIAFGATLMQFILGPLVFFTLPWHGVTLAMFVVICVGVALAIAAMVLMWREIHASDDRIGRLILPVIALIMTTGFAMGYGRHLYREGAISEHRFHVAARTADFERVSAMVRRTAELGIEPLPVGQRVFRDFCSACHDLNSTVSSPNLREIARLYRGNPEGIADWTIAPGRKRPDLYPQGMPPQVLPREQLLAVAEYMIELGLGDPDGSGSTTGTGADTPDTIELPGADGGSADASPPEAGPDAHDSKP